MQTGCYLLVMDRLPRPVDWGDSSHYRLAIGYPPPWNHPRGCRLPLYHPTRIMARDHKVWNCEVVGARQSSSFRIFCPCTECNGTRKLELDIVWTHLEEHGRHPRRRVSTVPTGEYDSSDDEWAHQLHLDDEARRAQYLGAALANTANYNNRRREGGALEGSEATSIDEGIDVQRMVRDIFQNLDAFYEENEDLGDMEEEPSDAEEDPHEITPKEG